MNKRPILLLCLFLLCSVALFSGGDPGIVREKLGESGLTEQMADYLMYLIEKLSKSRIDYPAFAETINGFSGVMKTWEITPQQKFDLLHTIIYHLALYNEGGEENYSQRINVNSNVYIKIITRSTDYLFILSFESRGSQVWWAQKSSLPQLAIIQLNPGGEVMSSKSIDLYEKLNSPLLQTCLLDDGGLLISSTLKKDRYSDIPEIKLYRINPDLKGRNLYDFEFSLTPEE